MVFEIQWESNCSTQQCSYCVLVGHTCVYIYTLNYNIRIRTYVRTYSRYLRTSLRTYLPTFYQNQKSLCHHARACSRHMMLYAHLQPDLGELLYVWGCFPRLGGENDNTTLAKHLIECARSWSLQSDTKSQELPGFGPSGHNLATSKAYSKILRDSEERGSNGALNYISPSILCISNGQI